MEQIYNMLEEIGKIPNYVTIGISALSILISAYTLKISRDFEKGNFKLPNLDKIKVLDDLDINSGGAY